MKKSKSHTAEKNPVNEIFGGRFNIDAAKQRIKQLREAKNLSQQKCADACGISRESYNQAERINSSAFFTVTQLHNLRFVLSTTLSYIFDGSNSEESDEIKQLRKKMEDLENENANLKDIATMSKKLISYYEKK